MRPEYFKIKAYSSISQNRVVLNGKMLYSGEESNFSSFIKEAYKKLDTQYPKFFKMDHLCKLGFLATDILLKHLNRDQKEEHNLALVFSNSAASLDTDRLHQNSVQDQENYYPSPAIFVYTLPNICLGEISIKHTLYSENSFFIFNHFNAGYLYDYASSLLQTGKADEVLCGWVDCDGEEYEAFVYLVSTEGSIAHTKEEITNLYTTK